MTENIVNFPTTLPTLRLTKAVAPPPQRKRKSDERVLMQSMEVGDCFACPDDESFRRAQDIAADMHYFSEFNGHRRFRTQSTMNVVNGKWVKDRRVWRVA